MQKGQQPSACEANGGWPFVLGGAVGKWLNPTPLQGGSLPEIRRFESDQRLSERMDYATSTMTDKLLIETTAL